MPVIDYNDKIEPLNELNNVTRQVQFGYGDINISSGLLQSDVPVGVILFAQQDPQPIGTPGLYEKGDKVELNQTPVRLIFEKTESIDILIEHLMEAKRYMIQGGI